jgi:uncharacterized protein (TIGR02118 family)
MIKFTILLKRNPALSQEDFVQHHKTIHADLFMSMPVVKKTVRAYIQQHALPVALPGLPPVKYDGITELWFDSVEALAECFSDQGYLDYVRPDEATFLDLHGCDFIVSTENKVHV